jgi:membrane-associated phospholipid phosphatase
MSVSFRNNNVGDVLSGLLSTPLSISRYTLLSIFLTTMMKSSSNVGAVTNSNISDEEMAPLRHSSSSLLHYDDQDPAEKNKGDSANMKQLLLQAIFWILFGVFGWYFPRFLIHRENSIMNKRPPFQMVGDTVVKDFLLNEPVVRPATVDSFLLKSSALYLPFVFLILHAWNSTPALWSGGTTASRTLQVQLVATVVSAFGMAVGLSEGTTVMIKLWVQRRRPNFYALCQFDASMKQCTATLEDVREANFSFPSGHSSLVCCGMTFLAWYLNGHYHTNGNYSHRSSTARLHGLAVCTLLPYAWALFVAASRLVDHWHHPSDVVAGLCLGFATCTVAYHFWYPPIWSHGAGIPRSMLGSVAKTDRGGSSNAVNSKHMNRLQPQLSSAGSEIQMMSTGSAAIKGV